MDWKAICGLAIAAVGPPKNLGRGGVGPGNRLSVSSGCCCSQEGSCRGVEGEPVYVWLQRAAGAREQRRVCYGSRLGAGGKCACPETDASASRHEVHESSSAVEKTVGCYSWN